ncbi:hypothetical protein GOODEAATRI_017077 [Goodea atripinnis]|uniref:Apolipoprotein D n=1 Tax=Goodea atripinnis TaxID=208336 RepID=A0ABV0MSR4_9TELE
MSANGDVASAAVPIASEMPEGQQVGVQGGAQCWPQAESSPPGGDTTSVQDSEPRRKEDEVSSWETLIHSNLHPSTVSDVRDKTQQVELDSENVGKENCRKSTPGLIFTNEFGDEIEDGTGDEGDKRSRSLDGSVSEYETAEEWADGGQGGGWERMPIPSVVIEPASSNEGDDDRDADIISPTAVSDNSVTSQSDTLKHMSPSGDIIFILQVETMHDFEAANSDELELKRVTPYSPYWVLTTDYTSVAVVYSCTDILRLFHVDYAWILSRSRFLPAETVRYAKQLLVREEIDISRMKATDQNCKDI